MHCWKVHDDYGLRKAKRFIRSCAKCTDSDSFRACAKFHPGICSPWLHLIVSNDYVCGRWRFWSHCADAQADLGLRCSHSPEGTFSHGAARLTKKCSILVITMMDQKLFKYKSLRILKQRILNKIIKGSPISVFLWLTFKCDPSVVKIILWTILLFASQFQEAQHVSKIFSYQSVNGANIVSLEDSEKNRNFWKITFYPKMIFFFFSEYLKFSFRSQNNDLPKHNLANPPFLG